MDPALATFAMATCFAVPAALFCWLAHLGLRDLVTSTARDEEDEPQTRGTHKQDSHGAEAVYDESTRRCVIGARMIALALVGSNLFTLSMIWSLREFSIHSMLLYIGWGLTDVMALVFTLGPVCWRYTSGSYVALSSLALSLALIIDYFWTRQADRRNPSCMPWCFGDQGLYDTLIWIQLALSICLSWVTTWVPQRPISHHYGESVDQYSSCSTSERLSFAWIRPFLDRARQSYKIEYSDLPLLNINSRTRVMKENFPDADEKYDARHRLWKGIAIAHWAVFVKMWVFCVLESIMMVMPSLCLYQILRHLEDRTSIPRDGDDFYSGLGLLVFSLAASKLAHVTLDGRVLWHAFTTAINVRAQISALVYAKALRMRILDGDTSSRSNQTSERNDRSSTPDVTERQESETDPLLPKPSAEATVADGALKNQEEEAKNDTATNGIVTLISMDVIRIYIFTGWNVDLIRGILKLVTGTAFLVLLLGWWSTLAGFAIPVVLHPLNHIIGLHYTKCQSEISTARDENSHIVTEALNGIRQIKFSASEAQWEAQILSSRRKLLGIQWKIYMIDIWLVSAFVAIPVLMGATSLSVYALLHHEMTASIAFTVLAVFSSLEWTIGGLPMTITEMIDAMVGCARVETHLNSDERQPLSTGGDQIRFVDATITWPSTGNEQGFTLPDLNVDFPKEELSVIYGKTGSGKSLLLASILGEAELLSGTLSVPETPSASVYKDKMILPQDWIIPNARALVAQVPWIENASVRDSIIYGLPYHQDRYKQVTEACALDVDIKSFPDGDDTEIGAKGINLSGGQKWRLTLARALYSRAGILILDDIFSAVDVHVGRHLLQHAITGKLANGRTRILVTHHLGLVAKSARYVVDLDRRTTSTPEEIIQSHSISKDDEYTTEASDDPPITTAEEKSSAAPRKFVEDEKRAKGRVESRIYMAYLSASGGYLRWLMALLVFILSAASTVYRSYWLASWTKSYAASNESLHDEALSSTSEHDLKFYLGIYLGLTIASVIFSAAKFYMVFSTAWQATRRLFEQMTERVLRAKMRWLDTEPTGRILNRFVADFTTMDRGLGMDITCTIDGTFHMIIIVVAALLVSLWMLIPMIILFLTSLYIVYLYLDGARDIKRLESISKSPVLELASSSLSGLATIRSFGRVDHYLNEMYSLLDNYTRATYYSLLASSWIRFRQGALGVLLTLTVAIIVCSLPGIDSALAGFALSFALNFSTVIDGTLIRYTALELEMNCTERVVEYTELETEPQSGTEPPVSWPSVGRIDVQNLTVAYAEDLPPVLKSLSFTIQPGERIGIVGRTGSGKTSLTLALFRLLEAREGRIVIDDHDIAEVPLQTLRTRLSIIPQDPVLFSGTLRSNLDPAGRYDDEVLWEALRRVRLVSSALPQAASSASASGSASPRSPSSSSDFFANLAHPVARHGANLSQGQKQLVCLARALLVRPRVLVLDEATSAVDGETDAAIQRSLREEFGGSNAGSGATLLVVAHRLSTVADFDRILVLEAGELVEFDTPRALAEKENGVFAEMLRESGEGDRLGDLLG